MSYANTAPAFVRDEEAHKRAVAFLKAAKAEEGADYKWVWDYAKGLWDYRNRVFTSLEEKAEYIIRYFGAGTGLFAVGVLAKIDGANWHVAAASLPAVVCALVAIFFALWSRRPGPFPGLPTVESAKQCADHLKSETAATAAFLGQWNLACEDTRLICDAKARWVSGATVAAYIALLLLLLPVVVAVVRPPTEPPARPASPAPPVSPVAVQPAPSAPRS